MQKSMELNSEEQELILIHRKQKEQNEPQLEGLLKEDVFLYTGDFYEPFNVSSRKEKEKYLTLLEKSFKLIPAGTEFLGYIKSNDEEWYDQSFEIEGMCKIWAQQYLTNIHRIPNKKRK